MKQCTKCKELKSKDLFSKLQRSPDGLQCACKQCIKHGVFNAKSESL